MFDTIGNWFSSIFGKGKLIFKLTMNDGSSANVKLHYLGDYTGVDMEDLKKECIEQSQPFLEYGQHITNVKYIRREEF